MSKTAWSRASSVPSDRILPSNASQSNRRKGKAKANEPPKSKQVLRLENLVAALRSEARSKDPKGGCFCQARGHSLSEYTPICLRCGLVLCSLHAPHYPCPHCASPLLSPSEREVLIQTLTEGISGLVSRETEQREREREELQQAAGAFPSLSAFPGNSHAAAMVQPRRVLSLNQQTRKLTIASYIPVPPHGRAQLDANGVEEEEKRVLPPPKEVDHVKGTAAVGRPWQNLRGNLIVYVPPPRLDNAESSRSGLRRKMKGPAAGST